MCKKAIMKAAIGKWSRQDVHIYAYQHIDEYSKALKEMILKDEFQPNPYEFEDRYERGKLRKLCKPKFWPDQCVHHLLIDSIQEFLYKRLDKYAMSSVPKRGTVQAAHYLEKWICKDRNFRGTRWCFKGDIKKCFESLTPEILYPCWQRIVKDPIWLSTMKKVLYNHTSLPIGLYISAWTLNIILKPFDEEIRSIKGVRRYLRYMDDFVIFAPSKKILRMCIPIIKKHFGLLGVELKHTWQIFKISYYDTKLKKRIGRKLDMVGYKFSRECVSLRKKNFLHIRKLQNAVGKAFKQNKNPRYDLAQSYVSTVAMAKHCENKTILDKTALDINKTIDYISAVDSQMNKGEITKPENADINKTGIRRKLKNKKNIKRIKRLKYLSIIHKNRRLDPKDPINIAKQLKKEKLNLIHKERNKIHKEKIENRKRKTYGEFNPRANQKQRRWYKRQQNMIDIDKDGYFSNASSEKEEVV